MIYKGCGKWSDNSPIYPMLHPALMAARRSPLRSDLRTTPSAGYAQLAGNTGHEAPCRGLHSDIMATAVRPCAAPLLVKLSETKFLMTLRNLRFLTFWKRLGASPGSPSAMAA